MGPECVILVVSLLVCGRRDPGHKAHRRHRLESSPHLTNIRHSGRPCQTTPPNSSTSSFTSRRGFGCIRKYCRSFNASSSGSRNSSKGARVFGPVRLSSLHLLCSGRLHSDGVSTRDCWTSCKRNSCLGGLHRQRRSQRCVAHVNGIVRCFGWFNL